MKEGVEYTRINANGKEGLLIADDQTTQCKSYYLSNEMEKKCEELKEILPTGVTIKPYYVQADFVNESVKSVTDSLWIGLALAIVVAIIFLRSLKASATILITIPVTICAYFDCNVCSWLYVKHHDTRRHCGRHRFDH